MDIDFAALETSAVIDLFIKSKAEFKKRMYWQDIEAGNNFYGGEIVYFFHKGQMITGKAVKINRRTMWVWEIKPVGGRLWKVNNRMVCLFLKVLSS